MVKLKIVELFAGAGGLGYGFARNNNFEIVAANEMLPNMAQAYSLNNPSVKMYNEDIATFTAKRLYRDLNLSNGAIDIVIGGPPCQSYSTVGKREEGDPRGELYKEYFRVIKELSPKFFIFENVKGLLSIQKGQLFKDILQLFESLDYQVTYSILNAADFGVPQIRERVFIVGSKLGASFSFPEPTHFNPEEELDIFNQGLEPYLTLEDAISDLPFIKSNASGLEYSSSPNNEYQKIMRENAPKALMDHISPRNNSKLVQIMELLPDGGTPEDLPVELRPTSGFKNTYSRLWWKRPSTTITRNLSTPSSSRCIHPIAPRPLTTREGARIQSFPDSYIFYGSRSDKNLQIGNAVPPFLSIALADSVLCAFKEEGLVG